MARSNKNQIVLIFLVFISLFFFKAADAVSFSPVHCECLWSDEQPCCKFLYDQWSWMGASQGTQWDLINLDLDYLTINSASFLVKFQDFVVQPGQTENICLEDTPSGEFVLEGGWGTTGGYMDTPPINWVEDIDDYYANPDPQVRKCAEYTNVMHADICPGDGQFDLSPYIDGQGNIDVPAFCDANDDNSYIDQEFQLPTWLTLYTSYASPSGGAISQKACVGTQVNCDAKGTRITTTGPIRCDNEPFWDDGDKTYKFGCQLAGGTGLASVTINSQYNCFTYLEKGLFSKPASQMGIFFNWLAWPGGGCPEGQGLLCWVRNNIPGIDPGDPRDPGRARQNYCRALYYPLALTNPSNPLSGGSVTYNLDVVDCNCSIDPVTIPVNELPADKQMILRYSNMYPGDHGTPNLEVIDCGNSATYGGGGCNDGGVCTFWCQGYQGRPGDEFTVSARIWNSAKFADCEGPVRITEEGDLNVVLQASDDDGASWKDPLNTQDTQDIDLKATVPGTATGDITYRFDCNNDGSPEYTITSPNEVEYAWDRCDYPGPGTYTAGVRAERNGFSDDDTATIIIESPTLSVNLLASDNNGTAWHKVLQTNDTQDIDLKATVSGTATGDISYQFDCESDGTYDYTFAGIQDNPKTVIDACDYPGPGTYTAKVAVNRQGLFDDDTATIIIEVPGSQILNVLLDASDNNGVGWSDPLNTEDTQDIDLRAQVFGTAEGPISYHFDCESDGVWDYEVTSDNETMLAMNLCDYLGPGVYNARVRAERGTAEPAEDTATIIITGEPPDLSVLLDASDNNGVGWSDPLGTEDTQDIDLRARVGGTAYGTVNFEFDCDKFRDAAWDFKIDGVNLDISDPDWVIRNGRWTRITSPNTFAVKDICDYLGVGAYTANVRTERGAATPAEDEADIIIGGGFNNPPSAVNLGAEPINGCPDNPSDNNLSGRFYWTFWDQDGDQQGDNPAYRIQVATDRGFSDLIVNQESNSRSNEFIPAGQPFQFNSDYYWRIKVWDEHGTESAWSYPPNSGPPPSGTGQPGTPFNAGWQWPFAEFKCCIGEGATPDQMLVNCLQDYPAGWPLCEDINPNPEDTIIFDSTMSTGAVNPFDPNLYKWNFSGASLSGPIWPGYYPYMYAEYAGGGVHNVRLELTDSNGHTCDKVHRIRVGGGGIIPPNWWEIIPFSWFQEILAATLRF